VSVGEGVVEVCDADADAVPVAEDAEDAEDPDAALDLLAAGVGDVAGRVVWVDVPVEEDVADNPLGLPFATSAAMIPATTSGTAIPTTHRSGRLRGFAAVPVWVLSAAVPPEAGKAGVTGTAAGSGRSSGTAGSGAATNSPGASIGSGVDVSGRCDIDVDIGV
jgi:hypothetical protein